MEEHASRQQVVMSRLKRIRVRMLFLDVVDRVLWGIFAGLGIFWLVLLTERLFYFHIPVLALGAELLGVGMLAGILMALLRFPSLEHVAIIADGNLVMKERLSTALALIRERRGRPSSGEARAESGGVCMEEAVLIDAAERARQAELAMAAPMPVPRALRLLPIPICLFFGTLFFMPQLDLLGSVERADKEKQRVAALTKKIEPMEKAKERLEKLGKARELKEAQKTAEELAKLVEAMETKMPEKKEILEKLTSMKDELEERAKGLQDKKDMARDLAKALSEQGKEGKEGEEDEGEKSELEKQLAEGRFDDAANKLEQLKDKLAKGEMSEEEKAGLQKELEKLADKMGDKQSLQDLAKKLADAQRALGEKDLKSLMDKLGEMAKDLKDLESSLSDAEGLELALDELENLKQAMADTQEGDEGTCPSCGQNMAEGKGKPCPGKGSGEG
ncbi:MAG: hypothetical protein RDV41_08425 [Planctomycetota bacterium]|nr:hypothetical protein [Planctomycetota bacterium]